MGDQETMVAAQPILYGIFRALLDRNVAVGAPDYLDALRALRQGFGGPRETIDEARHAQLRWLCEALWAREEAEVRLIRDLFAAIQPPSAAESASFDRWLGVAEQQPPAVPFEQPSPRPPRGGPIPPIGPSDGMVSPAKSSEAALRIEVETPDLQEGWRLPPQAARLPAGEAFVLEPETILPMRTLAVAWRRLRSLVRSGAKVEFDVHATIAWRCREGVLAGPVMRARRLNRSWLIVLADVSTSMAPWLPFVRLVEQSLPLGRLRTARVLYFANVPRKSVFAERALSAPVALDQLAIGAPGAGMLIVSDAGAARGFLNYRRADQTAEAIRRVAPGTRAIVWLNPMPPHRWAGTTAEPISELVPMLPLTRRGLSLAVDILRGAKSR